MSLLITLISLLIICAGSFFYLGRELQWKVRGVALLAALVLVGGGVGALVIQNIGGNLQGAGITALVIGGLAALIAVFMLLAKELDWKPTSIVLLAILMPASFMLGAIISLLVGGFR